MQQQQKAVIATKNSRIPHLRITAKIISIMVYTYQEKSMHTICELSAGNSGVKHAAPLLNSIRLAVTQYQHCQAVKRVACRMPHASCLIVVGPQCPVATTLPLCTPLLPRCVLSPARYQLVSSLVLILFAVNSPAGAVKRHKSQQKCLWHAMCHTNTCHNCIVTAAAALLLDMLKTENLAKYNVVVYVCVATLRHSAAPCSFRK